MSKQGIKPKVCLACDDLMRTGQAAPASHMEISDRGAIKQILEILQRNDERFAVSILTYTICLEKARRRS